MRNHIRVLLAKPSHDGHDRGVRYISRKFAEAGFEVVFKTFHLGAELADIAEQEDVDVIGISTSSHGHMPVFEDLFAALKEKGMQDKLVIAGGVIDKRDQAVLRKWGVSAIFGPGSKASEAIQHVEQNVETSDK